MNLLRLFRKKKTYKYDLNRDQMLKLFKDYIEIIEKLPKDEKFIVTFERKPSIDP